MCAGNYPTHTCGQTRRPAHTKSWRKRSEVELDLASGDSFDQLASVILNWVIKECIGRVCLDQAALLHNHNIVCDLADNGQVVSNEQVGQSKLSLQVVKQVQNLVLHEHVQSRHGLVQDNHFGVQCKRTRNGNALTLTTGKLVRVTTHGASRQSNQIE